MSDLFHEEVPEKYIVRLFGVMVQAHWHTFQVLTKRPERVAQMASRLPWPPNVWLGTSIENQEYVSRTDFLCKVPAAVRFLSIEPLLGPIADLALTGIGWVIVGGESGPGARYMDPEWVRSIRDRCVAAGVPFFFKQWGGVHKSRNGRVLDGQTWDEMPLLQPSPE